MSTLLQLRAGRDDRAALWGVLSDPVAEHTGDVGERTELDRGRAQALLGVGIPSGHKVTPNGYITGTVLGIDGGSLLTAS